STPYAILDNQDRVIAVLVGCPVEDDKRPPQQRWHATTQRVAELLESVRKRPAFARDAPHRRGSYVAVNAGISYGGGQKAPGTLKHTAAKRAAILDLNNDPDVRRIAHFTSDAMASYFPKAYAHTHESLQALAGSQPDVNRNFSRSVYPTLCYNMGPSTVALDHNDCNNSPDVPCSVTALGNFDPDKGGELYLWELRLIIRFPPGSSILIPSASLRHGNLPIQDGERRYSITQYCPGGLLRWVQHGFRPAHTLSTKDRQDLEGGMEERCRTVLGRLSTYGSLQGDRAWLLRQEASWGVIT
ncbi:hypothetical protein DENSPDRAFT_780795, partial [Dentipellis sp. KUC8613]